MPKSLKCSCGESLHMLFWVKTKPKHAKVNTSFAYCPACDKVYRVKLEEVVSA